MTGGEPAREAVVDELRAWGLLALDRLDPLVERLAETVSARSGANRTGAAQGHADGAPPCASCPVCAALDGAHGDAVAQAVRHAAGLVAALRAALGPAAPVPEGPARPERVVQRIPVERVPPC